MVRIVFSGMGFSRIDDKKLKTPPAVFLIELGQWRNLPHERRSSYAAELQQDMLFSDEIRE